MKEIEVSGDIARKKASLKRARIARNVVIYTFAILAVLCLIGLLVAVIMLNVGERAAPKDLILYILTGSFAGGGVVFAFAAVGISRLAAAALLREYDFRERCDGEDSFFVGDGTLATFKKDYLLIHDETDEKREKIRVPYAEMRFFSVCTRTKPREKGEWGVVLEIPVHYLAKEGKAEKNAPPALVQTDGKERLYRCLEKFGLVLLGEQAPRGELPSGQKFTPMKKFRLPNARKRRRSAIFLALGVLLVVGGVLTGVFWQVTIGAVLGVFGIVFTVRSAWAFVRAQAALSVYKEGLYWQDSARTECKFLKWEEIVKITPEVKDDMPLFKVSCIYGDYHFPAVMGAREFLLENFAEKCEELG